MPHGGRGREGGGKRPATWEIGGADAVGKAHGPPAMAGRPFAGRTKESAFAHGYAGACSTWAVGQGLHPVGRSAHEGDPDAARLPRSGLLSGFSGMVADTAHQAGCTRRNTGSENT